MRFGSKQKNPEKQWTESRMGTNWTSQVYQQRIRIAIILVHIYLQFSFPSFPEIGDVKQPTVSPVVGLAGTMPSVKGCG
jgi:hypothetical protein